MNYDEALKKIHSLLSFGSRPGLDRVRTLLERMGNPQDKLKYIHVAGTNGKGSVCAMLSSVLVEAGYKTGLFISPYITDFRERIQINNKMIDKQTLTDAVEKTFPLVQQLNDEGVIITEFEYVNSLQFYIHANAGCDIVVLETGMGGLLDCTNVIKSPLCSVITTIGLDHTAVLGDTIEKISAQKCGIIKKNSIAVTSHQTDGAMQVIRDTVKSQGIELVKSDNIKIDVISQTLNGSEFDYNGARITLNLAGQHQIENAKTAIACLEILRSKGLIEYTDNQLAIGLKKAVNPARLELLSDNPTVLLDGAHNPNGIEALQKAVARFLPHKKPICLIGMLADKDIDSSLELLSDVFDTVYTVPVDNPRAINSNELAQRCKPHFAEVKAFDSVKQAFDTALEQACKLSQPVVVCGSLYLAGEIRPYIIEKVR